MAVTIEQTKTVARDLKRYLRQYDVRPSVRSVAGITGSHAHWIEVIGKGGYGSLSTAEQEALEHLTGKAPGQMGWTAPVEEVADALGIILD